MEGCFYYAGVPTGVILGEIAGYDKGDPSTQNSIKHSMKILHVEYGFDYPFPGGEQKRAFEECRRLAQTDELLLAYSSFHTDWRGSKKEFDPKEIPFKTVSLDIQESYQPWRRNLARTLLLPVRRKVAKPIIDTIKSFKPDIIHLHAGGGRALINAVYAAKSSNIPIVMMMHNHWPLCAAIGYFDFKTKTFCKDEVVCGRCLNDRFKPIVSFLYRHRFARYVLKHIDHYICYTEFTQALLTKAGISPEKVTVIPPGIESVTIKNGVDFSRRKYITFSGRISPEKGPDIFLEVAKHYEGRNDLQFILTGDGFSREEMEKLAAKLQLKNVTFTGWIDDREKYFDILSHTKALIVPSLWIETFGIILLDAFQCGVPVIASNRGGVPLVVEDGKHGFVVEPTAPEIISRLDAIIDNPSLWERMSKACMDYDFKKFSWDRNAEQLRQLYQKVIEEHGRNH